MDETKILNLLNYADKKEDEAENAHSSFLHTNPILKERLFSKIHSSKNKFSIKDLFK